MNGLLPEESCLRSCVQGLTVNTKNLKKNEIPYKNVKTFQFVFLTNSVFEQDLHFLIEKQLNSLSNFVLTCIFMLRLLYL